MVEHRTQVRIIGCGYIGLRLGRALLERSLIQADHLLALVKTPASREQCLSTGINSIYHDLDDPAQALNPSLNSKNALLYYFAPPPAKGSTDPRVQNFLHHIEAQPPAKIVLISTTGVYGNSQGQWVNEDSPLHADVERSQRRLHAEQQCQSFCQKLAIPLVILRVAGIYGPGKLPLKRILAGTPIVRAEDSPYSNRIHTDDLLEICIKAGVDTSINGIFNCADGQPTTMYDYFIKVARTHQLAEPPAITLAQATTQLSAGMLSYMSESRRVDNGKLLRHFKLSLKYPDLTAGLAAIKNSEY